MPNPQSHYMLPRESALKANEQLKPMSDYLQRFTRRLEELHVAKSDPLFEAAEAAQRAMNDLSIAIVLASKPPGKTKWE